MGLEWGERKLGRRGRDVKKKNERKKEEERASMGKEKRTEVARGEH